jgi:4-hydroxybenzoate polyprenyltransferase
MHPLIVLRDRARWLFHRFTATTFVTDLLPGAGGRMRSYARLLRLDKPIGIWLLLWPVLWALWISAEGNPNEHTFLVFVQPCS